MTKVVAVIVAAGRGLRIGGDVRKQYRVIGGKALVAHAVDAFLSHPAVTQVVAVINGDDGEAFRQALGESYDHPALLPAVTGGATRQESVRAGLEALESLGGALSDEAIVLVHDAARPFVSPALIGRAVAAAQAHGAAIPVLPVSDTIKQVGADGLVATTPPRDSLRAVQTPQAFRYRSLRDAHRAAARAGVGTLTDDAAVCEWAGLAVATFAGEEMAFKITLPADMDRAERTATVLNQDRQYETRVATGYDVHALGAGDHVWLGGVRIAHEQALIGHSDADPVLHALTDALLGAIGDGDIGVHFPPSDERWRGAPSHLFLADAARRVREAGGRIVHLDATIVCESPKVGPHRDAMRAAIAGAAGIAPGRVGLKATTSERLGFTGRREGIAALATATVEMPRDAG